MFADVFFQGECFRGSRPRNAHAGANFGGGFSGLEGAVLARAIPGNAPRATRAHEFAVEPIIEPFRRRSTPRGWFFRALRPGLGIVARAAPFYYS